MKKALSFLLMTALLFQFLPILPTGNGAGMTVRAAGDTGGTGFEDTVFSIELDYTVTSGVLSLLFGASDTSNFYMWQIGAYSWHDDALLRPHKCTAGSYNPIATVPLAAVFPDKDDAVGRKTRLFVEVNEGTVKTSVNGVPVDTRTVTAFPLGFIGFRAAGSEDALVDYITVRNSEGTVLLYDDFENGINTKFDGGTIVNKQLRVYNTLFLNKTDTSPSTAAVTKPQVEQTDEPMGIDVAAPNFSWQMSSDTRGQKQTGYRIAVSTTEAKLQSGDYDMWDSGRVKSEQSNYITYAGNALLPSARYYWKVFVWDVYGKRIESGAASFETGLMSSGWSGAQWITAGDIPPQTVSTGVFTLDADFMIVNDAFSILFGATDSSNFYMWQIGAYSWCTNIMLRPHKCTNGSFATIGAQPYLNSVFAQKSDGIGTTNHLKIDVNNGLIRTYVNGILVDTRTVEAFNPGNLGFRSTSGGGNNEHSYADNIVLRDGEGNILFSEDFSNASNFKFTKGTVENGRLKLTSEGEFFQKDAAVTSASAPMMRRGFTLQPKTVKSARLYATAAGIYEMYLNGEKVTDSYFNPGSTQYNKHILYQTFDVTGLVTQGANVLAGVLGHGWFNRANRNFGPDLCLYAKLLVTYADGTTDIVVTDGNWKYYWDGPILDDDFFMGYKYNANKEQDGWTEAGYDDSRWVSVKTKASGQILNWGYAMGTVVSQPMPLIRNTRILRPIAVTEPSPGVYIYDFGQNFAGIPRIRATAAKGTVLQARYGEMLNRANMSGGDGPEGTLYTENLHEALNTDQYTFRGDAAGEVFEPSLVYHGFRYMEITGLSSPPSIDDVEGLVIGTDLAETSAFESSNSLLNQFYSNALWSWRSNAMSVPTDCPQRNERWGWTGDAHIFARTASYFSDINTFYMKYMQDMRDTQNPTGEFHDVAPGVNPSGWGLKNGNATNGWGDAGVIIPWQLYQQYGNKDIIVQNYDAMCKWVDYLISTSNDDPGGYIRAKGWTGDWLGLENTPFGVIDTAYCANSAKLLSKMAAVIGNGADAAKYEQEFQNYKAAWNQKYVNADGKTSCDTQTSYVVGLAFELFEPSQREGAAARLVSKVRAMGNHLTTGFLGVSLLNPTLSDYGYSDAAFDLMEQTGHPSWLYSVTTGSTTIWEGWSSLRVYSNGTSSVASQSFNHYSYGAAMEWLFRDVAGIERDEDNPGFKHILLQPTIGGSLTYAAAEYDSIYGKIVSDWNIDPETGVLTYRATVPANTTATLFLPDPAGNGSVRESGIFAEDAEGVTFVGKQDGRLIYLLTSGSYVFSNILNENTLTVNNPQNIPSTVTVGGVPSPLPYSELLSSTQSTLSVVSNDPNYEFACFTGDLYDAGESITAAIREDMTLDALFRYVGDRSGGASNKLLTINGPAGNKIRINGTEATLPYSASFPYGANVVIEPGQTSAGKIFAGLSGSMSLSFPAFVGMYEDISLTALYEDAAVTRTNFARGLTAVISNNQESPEYGWSRTYLTDGVTAGTGYTSGPIYTTPALASPITLDFDLGSDKPLSDIVFYPRTDAQANSTNNHVFPQDFTISVKTSAAGGYTVLKTITGHADSATPVSFNLDGVCARHVRVAVTKLNALPAPGDTMYRLQFAEIEIHGDLPVDTVAGLTLTGLEDILSGVGKTTLLTADVQPAAISGETLVWTARDRETGDLSRRVQIISQGGKTVTVKALASGFVNIIALAGDGSGVSASYSLIIEGDSVNYVTYHANGGTGAVPVRTPILAGYPSALDKTSILSKPNCFFAGWGLTPDAAEPIGDIISAGNASVYALWTEKPEWKFATHFGGWELKSGSRLQKVENSAAYITTSPTDQDFYLTLKNISLDADRYRYLRVKIKNSSSDTGDGLYYVNSLTGLSESSKIPLPIDANMSDFKVYEYHLAATTAGSVYWKGTIDTLRYDVITGTDRSFALDYVRFSDKAAIFSAALSGIPAPVAGEAPFTGIPSVAGEFTAGNVTWDCEEGVFDADTSYTASVTLTPNAGYEFIDTGDMQITLNGFAAEAINKADGTLLVSYTFYPSEYELTASFTDPSGAAGEPPSDIKVTITPPNGGADITLPENPFTRAGYTFAGWFDGKETASPGSVYRMTRQSIAFTAVWERNLFGLSAGQVLAGTTADSPHTTLRLLVGINRVDCTEIGFILSSVAGIDTLEKAAGSERAAVLPSKRVFRKVITDKGDILPILLESEYLHSQLILEIPNSYFDKVFYITAYAKRLDGTVTYNDTKSYVINNMTGGTGA